MGFFPKGDLQSCQVHFKTEKKKSQKNKIFFSFLYTQPFPRSQEARDTFPCKGQGKLYTNISLESLGSPLQQLLSKKKGGEDCSLQSWAAHSTSLHLFLKTEISHLQNMDDRPTNVVSWGTIRINAIKHSMK